MPEIRKNLEEIVNKHETFNNATPDTLINNAELLLIKDELLQIKKEIEGMISDPEERSLYLQELQNMAIEKWVSREFVQQAFQQELHAHKKETIQIANVPQAEINDFNKELHESTTQKNKETNNQVQSTNTELLNTKAETVETMVNNIKDQVKMIKKQVRFATRGEGKDSRAVKRYIIERLNLADKRVNKYQRYHKKFDEKDYILKPEHEVAMFAKISTLLTNSKDYVSQAITGDLDEAKNFFHPNIFKDASFYIPDRTPSQSTRNRQVWIWYEQLSASWVNEYTNAQICTKNRILLGKGTIQERFAQNGLLWALDGGYENLWASPETRSRAYQVGNMIWSATKLVGGIWAGRNFLKSSWNTITGKKDAQGKGYAGSMAKYGAILAWGYVLGPSIDKLIKGGDTSVWAANLLGNTGATVETSDGKAITDTKELSEEEKNLLILNTKVSKELFGNISWSEMVTFTDSNGKIDYEKYKLYLEAKEGTQGERYKLLVQQEKARPTLQNFVFALTGKTYLESKAKLYPNEKFETNFEELKREADEFVEDYDGSDSANMRESITTIEQKMEVAGDANIVEFKKQKQQIERQLNILYLKHPKAHPISVEYNATTKLIEVGSYAQTTSVNIASGTPQIVSPYTTIPWNTDSQSPNEVWRLANLTNFLTDPRNKFVDGSGESKEPFNVSMFKGDVEFARNTQRDIIKNLEFKEMRDITVLQDSFFSSRLQELYPSIMNKKTNKKQFTDWLNSFKKSNGDSLWSKPRI